MIEAGEALQCAALVRLCRCPESDLAASTSWVSPRGPWSRTVIRGGYTTLVVAADDAAFVLLSITASVP